MRTLSLIGISAATIALLSGCGDDAITKPDSINLRILETTDTHGAIFPYDFINDTNQTYKKEPIPSMANISTYVKAQRKLEKDDNKMAFVLLDNGDRLQGQPIVNLYNNKDLTNTTHIYTDVMNYMKYDATVVGNHDVEPGHKVYDEMVKDAKYPWLAANIVKENSDETYFKPYTIVNKKGVKIAILGLTTPGVPSWLPQELWSGMEYQDMVDSAKKWVKKIQEDEKPDILIGLFHAGWDYNYGGNTKDTKKNPNAVQMVMEEVKGFDVIFYGHDHSQNITEINGVKALNSAAYAKSFAITDINLTLDKTTQKYVKNVNAYQLNSNDYAVDKEYMEKFKTAFEDTKAFVQQKVGTFTKDVNSLDANFKDSAFNDLIHELEFYVAKEELGEEIDMTIAAPLQFNVTINAGDVKFADMWKLYKYDNTYYIMELSGSEIKAYLEYNYDKWMNTMSDENDQLLNFKKDENGALVIENGCAQTVTRYYNYDSIAGITYTVNVSKPAGEKINITGIDKNLDGVPDDGATFDMNKKYKVGINSYRAGGGGGHMIAATGLAKEELPNARVLEKTETGLRDYLLQWIKDKGSVTPRAFNNWKVIPEAWATKGEAKSREELSKCMGH